jgi:hypothetical protein
VEEDGLDEILLNHTKSTRVPKGAFWGHGR